MTYEAPNDKGPLPTSAILFTLLASGLTSFSNSLSAIAISHLFANAPTHQACFLIPSLSLAVLPTLKDSPDFLIIFNSFKILLHLYILDETYLLHLI